MDFGQLVCYSRITDHLGLPWVDENGHMKTLKTRIRNLDYKYVCTFLSVVMKGIYIKFHVALCTKSVWNYYYFIFFEATDNTVNLCQLIAGMYLCN